MKKILFAFAALLTVSAGAYAQDVQVVETRSGEVIEVFEFENPVREFNYGFISVTGGTRIYGGDVQDKLEFGDRLAPVMDASIGKMFNPYIGFRLQWTGWDSYGATNSELTKFAGGLVRNTNDVYTNDFNLNYTHFDLLWNLSNSLGKARESRFWDFVPYVGVGWVNLNKVGHYPENRLGVNAGLLNQFRLSPSVDILLDFQAMGTNHNIDDVVLEDGKAFDITTSLRLGVAYNFGRVRKEAVAIDVTPYLTQIGGLERDLEAARARAAQLARDLESEKAKEKTVVNNLHLVSDLAVWFPINQSKLTEKEQINLGYIAAAIKRANKDKVYTIYGSADKQTGSPVINKRLSEQRAQAVYDELVKHGVPASQLRMNPVGDTQAKFDKPLLNRVAIVQSNE